MSLSSCPALRLADTRDSFAQHLVVSTAQESRFQRRWGGYRGRRQCIPGVGVVGADYSHLSASPDFLLGLREHCAQGRAGIPRVSDQLMWGFKGLTPLLHSETNMKGHSGPGAPRGCWDIVDTAAQHLPLPSSALFPSFLPRWTLVPIHVPTNPPAAYIPSLCLLLGNPNREHHRVRKQSASDAAQGS